MTAARWLDAITVAHAGRTGERATATQVRAWADCRRVLARALRAVAKKHPEARAWGLIFEYELPWEGGRRPDLVILAAAGAVVVVEFKMADGATTAAVDQVAAYSRDLALYHAATPEASVLAALVPTRDRGHQRDRDGVAVVPPSDLAAWLGSLVGGEPPLDLAAWLAADYAPLPSVVDAARRIFRREPLPAIRRAASAGIPAVLDHLAHLAADAQAQGGRAIVLITGVPGSGKTLVGLEFVYRQGEADGQREAVFLSGNGPLVDVLRYALNSKVFVRPLRNFYLEHEARQHPRAPGEHIIVFDEAQRAWDAERMAEKYQIAAAAPSAVTRIAGRCPGWSIVVGLIGAGQEIHTGEEGGPALWADAVDEGGHPWVVHAPPNLAATFRNLPPDRLRLVPEFDLTRSLRTHRADQLTAWIDQLLAGQFADAQSTLATQGFAAHLTRDLDAARTYCRNRYAEAPTKTFGLVASSRARNLPRYGVPNDFPSTQRTKLGPWFVDPASSPASCRALSAVATEFGCQGLELDLPIVAWGDDLTWDDASGAWTSRVRHQKGVRDPGRLRLNSYRVLLSRGRDGLVVFVPPEALMDATYNALLAAGLTWIDPGSLPSSWQ